MLQSRVILLLRGGQWERDGGHFSALLLHHEESGGTAADDESTFILPKDFIDAMNNLLMERTTSLFYVNLSLLMQ